jgi:hypothetical protein
MWLLRKLSSAIGIGTRAFFTLVGIAGITYAVADYNATQGAGTAFGSVIQTSVHYSKQVLCDFVAPATICATVKASNTVASTDVGLVVAVANTNNNGQAAMTGSSPVVIASNQTLIPVNPEPLPAGRGAVHRFGNRTTTGAVATLAGAASVTTYICGYSVRANATAAATTNIVVSGTVSTSLNFTQWVAPLASGLGVSEQVFIPCVPASAANTSIVVTGGAPGAGGVNSATAWGYKL